MTSKDYKCIHEELLQDHSLQIKGLESRADYKEQTINELKTDMKDLNDKMDKISEDINNFLVQSINDDKDLDKRVTQLENTVKVIKWIITLVFGSGVLWALLNFSH